nr:collagen alpha-1(III) chain-like [Meriones unguiculatus]
MPILVWSSSVGGGKAVVAMGIGLEPGLQSFTLNQQFVTPNTFDPPGDRRACHLHRSQASKGGSDGVLAPESELCSVVAEALGSSSVRARPAQACSQGIAIPKGPGCTPGSEQHIAHSTPAPCVVDGPTVRTPPLRIHGETTGPVRTKRGQRSGLAQEAEVKGSRPGSSAGKGLLAEGPRTPTAELREAWRRLEVAFPCRVGARPKAAAAGPRSAGSRAERARLFRKTITNPRPAGLRDLRVRLWTPRGPEAQPPRPADGAGTSSQRAAGRPFRGPEVEEGAAGASDSDPRRAALTTSLQPDRGPVCRRRAPRPRCGGSHLLATGPQPLARLAAWGGAGTGGREGCSGTRRRQRGRRELAVGTGPRRSARGAPGSAQGGAKEKVRPGPGQPGSRARAVRPAGPRGCQGDRVREGRSEGKRGGAEGRRAAGGTRCRGPAPAGPSGLLDRGGARATTRGTAWSGTSRPQFPAQEKVSTSLPQRPRPSRQRQLRPRSRGAGGFGGEGAGAFGERAARAPRASAPSPAAPERGRRSSPRAARPTGGRSRGRADRAPTRTPGPGTPAPRPGPGGAARRSAGDLLLASFLALALDRMLGTGPLRKHSLPAAPAWGPHPGHFKRTQVAPEARRRAPAPRRAAPPLPPWPGGGGRRRPPPAADPSALPADARSSALSRTPLGPRPHPAPAEGVSGPARPGTRLLRSPRRPPPPPPPLPLAPTRRPPLRAPRLENKQPRRRRLRASPPPGTPSRAGPVGPRSGAAAEGSAPRAGGRPCRGRAGRPAPLRLRGGPSGPGLRAPLGCGRGPQVSTGRRSAGARPLSEAGVLSGHSPPASPGPGASWAAEPEAQVEECALEKARRLRLRSLPLGAQASEGPGRASRVAPTKRPNGVNGFPVRARPRFEFQLGTNGGAARAGSRPWAPFPNTEVPPGNEIENCQGVT